MTARQVRKQLDDLTYKIKHGSGFYCKPVMDGSISDLISCVVESELMNLFISSIKEDGEFDNDIIKQYCNEYLNKWMILHHKTVVKNKHFNWNWP